MIGKMESDKEGHYVMVRREQDVSFPNRCVVCGKESNLTLFNVQSNPYGYFGYYTWLIGVNPKLSIPMHKECKVKFSRAYYQKIMVAIILCSLVAALCIYLGLSLLEGLGVLLLVYIILFAFQSKNPISFEFDVVDDLYELRFESEEYAREFASLNKSQVS